jgi:hypothetical protein
MDMAIFTTLVLVTFGLGSLFIGLGIQSKLDWLIITGCAVNAVASIFGCVIYKDSIDGEKFAAEPPQRLTGSQTVVVENPINVAVVKQEEGSIEDPTNLV